MLFQSIISNQYVFYTVLLVVIHWCPLIFLFQIRDYNRIEYTCKTYYFFFENRNYSMKFICYKLSHKCIKLQNTLMEVRPEHPWNPWILMFRRSILHRKPYCYQTISTMGQLIFDYDIIFSFLEILGNNTRWLQINKYRPFHVNINILLRLQFSNN